MENAAIFNYQETSVRCSEEKRSRAARGIRLNGTSWAARGSIMYHLRVSAFDERCRLQTTNGSGRRAVGRQLQTEDTAVILGHKLPPLTVDVLTFRCKIGGGGVCCSLCISSLSSCTMS